MTRTAATRPKALRVTQHSSKALSRRALLARAGTLCAAAGMRATGIGLGSAGFGAAGCAHHTERNAWVDLARNRTQPPLVFIPGSFGTELADPRTGRPMWPHSNLKLLFGTYDELGLDFDTETLEPATDQPLLAGVLTQGLGFDFYGRLLQLLTGTAAYRLRRPDDGHEPGPRDCWPYLYDWRRDNATAARGLAELITIIRAERGDPALRVDLLGHSNGGLIARWYQHYGIGRKATSGPQSSSAGGAEAINRLLLIGTPNRGTLQPVVAHLRGEEIGLRRINPEVLATCPGVTQLMPHPDDVWLIDRRGDPVRADVFDPETWRAFGWSIFAPDVRARVIARNGSGRSGRRYLDALERYHAQQLAHGRRFITALPSLASGSSVPLHLFGGDCAPTLGRLLLEADGQALMGREQVRQIARPIAGVDYAGLMFEPGDAVVTRRSLLDGASEPVLQPGRPLDMSARTGPGGRNEMGSWVSSCAEHRGMTGDPTLQRELLRVLFSPTPPRDPIV